MITLDDIHALDVTLQAEGKKISANQIVKHLGGSKRDALPLLRAYHGAPQALAPSPAPCPAPAPPPPVARPASVMPLEALRQRCADDDEVWRRLEPETQQHQQDRAQHWSAFRQALTEAQRLLPLFHRAQQASRLALYAGHAAVQEEAQRLRDALAALVGEDEVQALVADQAYAPWWLTAR
jgi:hypothetical protein